jgi:hypothetical protein
MIQVANIKQAAGEPMRFIEVRNYPNRVVNIPNNFKPKAGDSVIGAWRVKYFL